MSNSLVTHLCSRHGRRLRIRCHIVDALRAQRRLALQDEMAQMLQVSVAPKHTSVTSSVHSESAITTEPHVTLQTWLAFIRQKVEAQAPGTQEREMFRALDQGCWGSITLEDFMRIVAAVAPGISEQAARDAFAGLAGPVGRHVAWERWLELMHIAQHAAI